MSVTVDEIERAARAGAAALSGETAGYLMLGILDTAGSHDGRLSSTSVTLVEDGSVAVGPLPPGGSCFEAEARALLGELLTQGGKSVPALARVAATAERRGIPRLVTEIEAALIPVNRSAARRALARLHRDVTRAIAAGKLAPKAAPSPGNVAPGAGPAMAAVREDAAPVPPPSPTTEVVVSASPGAEAAAPPPVPVDVAAARAVEPLPPAPPEARHLVESPSPRIFGSPPPLPMPVEDPVVPAAPERTPALFRSAAIEPRLTVATARPEIFDAAWDEPEKTPFLGGWPGSSPVVTAIRDAGGEDLPAPELAEVPASELADAADAEPDTERQPDVVLDDAEPVAPWERTPLVEDAEPRDAEAAAATPAIVEAAPVAVDVDPGPCDAEPVAVDVDPGPCDAEPVAVDVDPGPCDVAPEAEAAEPDDAGRASDAPVAATIPVQDPNSAPTMPAADPRVSLDASEPVVTEPPPRPVPREIPVVAYKPRQSDVTELLAGFGVAESLGLTDMSRELKRIADASGTPCPPDVLPGRANPKKAATR